ncbi:hypothetical protein [Streptomyces crystallinus]|uniref:Uncharacterized protein n=1 Tax=Streptomyces crystallinus TaxID=68191 RepID=A0ABN1FAS1_9ACTN
MSQQPPSVTWQLRAGVHLDPRYRNAVLNELHEHEERYSAPAYDVDTAAVLAEALDARRTALRWAVPMALLWIAGFLFAGWLFALYAAGCAALSGAAALRPARRPSARVTAAALRVLGGSVLAGSLALAVAGARTTDWPRATAALAGPVLIAAVAGAHRAAVERRLRFIGSSAYSGSTRPPPVRGSGALVLADQTSALVVHRDPTPFLGSGAVLDSLALATEVRGRPGAFDVSHALARAARAVRAVPGLATQVEERFLLPEQEAPPRGLSHPRTEGLPDSIRWLRIVSRGLGPRLTTVFVQIRRDGPVLFVQQVTCALPPVRREFTAPGGPGARLVPLGAVPAIPGQLLAELAAWPVRRARRLSSPPAHRPPDGPHLSIRELAAEPDLPPLAAAEAQRISRTVHLLVLDAVRQELRERGLSAPGLDDRWQEAYGNTGIYIGSMSGGTVATGSQAHGTTHHTSPGPTTNPDDDSWEDDDLG